MPDSCLLAPPYLQHGCDLRLLGYHSGEVDPMLQSQTLDPSRSSQIYDGSESDGGKQRHFFQGLEFFIDTPPHLLWHPVSSLLYLPENVRMNLSLTFWASWGHLGQVFWSQQKAHVVQTQFSPTRAEYCSGRMPILSLLRAWLSFFLLYMGTMSLFGPRSWRTLCENSSLVGPRSPSLTTDTDSRHVSQDQVHGCKDTALLPHSAINWAHDTYHFSCLAFAGLAGGGGVALLPVFLVGWSKLSSFHS